MDREARGDQDGRVHTCHEDRQVEGLERPLGVAAGADEEVGREERPEEHDLRGDEEEHPERRGIHARALVRHRRPVMSFGVDRH